MIRYQQFLHIKARSTFNKTCSQEVNFTPQWGHRVIDCVFITFPFFSVFELAIFSIWFKDDSFILLTIHFDYKRVF